MKKLLLTALTQLLIVCPLYADRNVPAMTRHANFPRHEKPVAAAADTDEPSESDIYNVTMLVAENFDKLSAGSLEAPDENVLDGFIPSELTTTPYWSAYYVYQAGGCLLIDRSKNNNANLCSPVLEIPADDRPVTVTFKARLGNKNVERDWVEVYVADATDPNDVKTLTNDYAYVYDEWKEYKFVFTKKRPGTKYFFQFSGYDEPVFVDDIEIKILDPKIDAPVAADFSEFTNESFTANWSAVDGADAYKVSLYQINDDRDKTRNYLVKDLRVDGCSHTFTGLETPTNTFYYVVKTVKGESVSPESNAVKVQSLTVPANIAITKVDNDNLKITWDAVTGAEYYVINAFRSHKAEGNETYTLSSENFDKLVCDGTVLQPEVPYQSQEELDEWTDQPGWIAEFPLHINGAYGLSGYYGEQYGYLVYLESPIMDLRAGGGKVKVSADLYGQKVNQTDVCTATFRTLKYVVEDGREKLVTTDADVTAKIPEAWTNYSFELGGGTAMSVVEIVANAGALYIDNLKITQDLKAGERVSVPYLNSKSKTNEITVPVSSLLRGSEIIVRIQAVREIWDKMHFSVNEYVRSPFSDDYSQAISTSGIDDIDNGATEPKAFVEGSVIRVVNPAGDSVEAYDMTGRLVAADRSGSQLIDLPVDNAGIYVVRVAGKAIKVVR